MSESRDTVTTPSAPGRLAGARVIVTGGAAGIGLAIARRLHEDGARVVIADLDGAAAERSARELCLAGAVALDVSSLAQAEEGVASAVALLGGLDGLVNNAGIEILGDVSTLTEMQWDRQFAVNVKGVFTMTKASLPHLRDGGGSIVNIASDVGVTGERGIDAYVATKHAVVGLTRALALTWGRDGVRTNAICPGTTDTALTERHLAAAPVPEHVLLAPIPQGRLGRPEDIAAMASFLLSDDAGYVNGALLAVDGGASAGYYFEPRA